MSFALADPRIQVIHRISLLTAISPRDRHSSVKGYSIGQSISPKGCRNAVWSADRFSRDSRESSFAQWAIMLSREKEASPFREIWSVKDHRC